MLPIRKQRPAVDFRDDNAANDRDRRAIFHFSGERERQRRRTVAWERSPALLFPRWKIEWYDVDEYRRSLDGARSLLTNRPVKCLR